MLTIELGLTLLSIGLAVMALYFSRRDKSTDEIKKMENRLTKLEERQDAIRTTMFTAEDRTCLKEMTLKMDLFWSIVEREFPRLLVQASTPKLDRLLQKASAFGIESLEAKEKIDLSTMLDDEYAKAVVNEDSGRAMAIALYRATIKYNMVHDDICLT